MKISWGKPTDPNDLKSGGTQNDALEALEAVPAPRYGRLSPDWMDDAFADYARQGGFEGLSGKGKPLELDESQAEDATLNRILANNHILPPWLALQNEIRDEVGALYQQLQKQPSMNIEGDCRHLNVRINKYNAMCPSPMLQKPLLSPENFVQQSTKWS